MSASCIYKEKNNIVLLQHMFLLLQAELGMAGLEGSGVNSDELLVKLKGGII